MTVLADRFARLDDGGWIDFATGERVVVIVAPAGDSAEQTRWAVRCDAVRNVRHDALAPLVDYGLVGASQRFEAWRCDGTWSGPPADAARVVARASSFLRACGLSSAAAGIDAVHEEGGRPVLLPGAGAGYPCDDVPHGPSANTGDDYGLVVMERRAVAALSEILQEGSGCRPRIVSLWGPPGSGKRTAARELARVARLNGFVPTTAPVLAAFGKEVAGRTLLLVVNATGAKRWLALLDACLRTPRPHVLLLVGTEEVASVQGLPLDRPAADALLAAVRPVPSTRAAADRLRRFAEQSEGLPGVFAQLVAGGDAAAWRRPHRSGPIVSRAAEELAVYGRTEPATARTGEGASWPAAELTSLRQRVDTGRRLAAEGRHAPGERLLRQAVAALARRGDWTHAGEGGLALASLLLKRGRAGDAQHVLRQAHEWCTHAGDRTRLLEVAVLAGSAWIDEARLDHAESVLGAALAAARAEAATEPLVAASLALARVAFWRGHYADARRVADELAEMRLPEAVQVRVAALEVRAAVGLRDVGRGVAAASRAVGCAETIGSPSIMAEATCAAAFAHLAVGDVSAIERDVEACAAAAARARDPLRAIRARLLLAEAYRRAGRGRAAEPIVARIGKLAAAGAPPILRVRWELLKDALKATVPVDALVARHATAAGLPAIALYVASDANRSSDRLDPTVTEIVDILHLCQTADEDGAVLRDVCARLRRHLRAVAVAVVAPEGSAPAVIASDGARIEGAVAERAMAAGMTIAPHQYQDRLEAASPIRYGGAIIGAIAARWTLGTPEGPSRASTLLPPAATAAGPAVSAALARRARPAPVAWHELVGVSAAIADVRRAVERAAPAPFAVLVEGESGSGKELVARALHRCSARRERAFRTVNCAALPDDLLEAELFGHARGAFTGAIAERAGVFEDAHGGTLFLDEAGELSPRAQAKLLRVIQEGELRRIGENVSRRIDVRIVSATNRDLRAEAAAGRFRLDLLYRLDVIRIVVPPLRERGDDIPLLVEHLWRDAAARVGSRASLAAATIGALGRYHWPGNVRELQNVLAALAVRAPKRGVVPPTALPPPFADQRTEESWRLDLARRTFEERFVRAALVRAGGRRARAAEELGVSRQGLTKLLARLGIDA